MNKATVKYFPLSNSVLLLQMIAVPAVIYPLKHLGYVAFPPLSLDKARALLGQLPVPSASPTCTNGFTPCGQLHTSSSC